MRAVAICALVLGLIFSLFASAYAFDSPVIILKSSFIDSEGRTNVIGTVRNFASMPVHVTVGVETDDGRTVQTPTYGRVIWPLTDSPFKLILERGVTASEPFIMRVQESKVPNYNNMLILSYDGMAVGEERAFVGTIKNVSPFNAYNVSVYAGIHSSDHKSQLDSVRSNVIPVIRSGEELKFTALPDPSVKQNVLYYSCAGLDFDAPINTLKTGDGGFIPFSLNAIAQVSNLRYEDSTDSFVFAVRPYFPTGGNLTLTIPQQSQNQIVTVMLDGKLHDVSIKGDGKTMYVDFFVPRGDHQVEVHGVRNVSEFPFAMLALAGVSAGVVALARAKAAFKIY